MTSAELHRPLTPAKAESPLPIVSRFATDPVLGPILREFVTALPTQLSDIVDAAHLLDQGRVKYLSHRLKGDAATYGFPELAHVAHELEQLTSGTVEIDMTALGRLTHALEVIGGRVVYGSGTGTAK